MKVDIYRKKWYYFLGFKLFYTLEFVKTGSKEAAKSMTKNKKYVI